MTRKSLLTFLGFLCVNSFVALADPAVLVEAEHFQTKGGWKVDQQFSDIIGSSYLLAHGLGTPVENAKTQITFPAGGTYRLWVRTTNWKPGDWDAPGRFRILIDKKPVETTFGVDPGWHWQSGGTVTVEQQPVTIELQDLTGFDGRCDALFFTQDPNRPPEDAAVLAEWRNRLTAQPAEPDVVEQVDVVIVGGGIAGCAAALAAEQQGLTVALIHDRPVPGGNASKEVRVHTSGITGKSAELLETINTVHWPNGSGKSVQDDRKRLAALTSKEKIRLFLSWRAFRTQTRGNLIESVDAQHIESGKTRRFRAPVFIDCTGDGWIGYWAGADYRYGRESCDEFNEAWDTHGELWSPKEADNRVMGASLMWRSRKAEHAVAFPETPWAMPIAKDSVAVKGDWNWEYSDEQKHQIDNAEEIRDHLLCAIYGSFANAKKDPENAALTLEWVGYILGKRESRRLMGDYIYTMNDMVENRQFPDTVAEEERVIDVHYQLNLDASPYDFRSKAIFREAGTYYIPFRCLYSKNIDNLMMAGRCFSCSHIGLGGPRVMHTTGQMGVAVGYAAALCKKYETGPRGIYQNHITELRDLIGYK